MCILKFSKPQVPTLRYAASSMNINVATKGGILLAIIAEPVGVEISYVAGQTLIRERVAFGMGGSHII